MKKYLLLVPIVALLCACNSNDDPQAQHQVTFRIPQLIAETQPMDAPRRTPILTDDDGVQMTDLFLFDGSIQIAHQTNSDENFGTVTVTLLAGEHHLHFIATRSTELSYDEGILNCTSLRPTFGKHYNLTVNGTSDENITLDRITGQVIITIEDAIPTGASNLHVQLGDYYKGINPTTFAATRSGDFDQTIGISGKIGTTDNSWTLNILVPTYNTQSTTSYTITATNAGGTVLGQATGIMPINSNTKTLLHGNLFSGTRNLVALTTAWNADINVDM
jgi:hypothetical protein